MEDFTLELSPTGRDHRAEMRSTRGDVGVTQTAPVVERIEREVANVDVELAGQARATVDTVASALVQLKWNAGTPGETENFFNHPWRFYADRTWTYDGVEPNGERTWTVCLEGTLIVLRVEWVVRQQDLTTGYVNSGVHYITFVLQPGGLDAAPAFRMRDTNSDTTRSGVQWELTQRHHAEKKFVMPIWCAAQPDFDGKILAEQTQGCWICFTVPFCCAIYRKTADGPDRLVHSGGVCCCLGLVPCPYPFDNERRLTRRPGTNAFVKIDVDPMDPKRLLGLYPHLDHVHSSARCSRGALDRKKMCYLDTCPECHTRLC